MDIRIEGLYVRQDGSGPVVIALHGGLGLDHRTLDPWLDPIAATHRLVRYDHRGNGRSAPATEPLTLASLAEDVERVRRGVTGEPVVVFGHSFGALVAQEYAARYPAGLRGLVLCATAPVLDYVPEALAGAQARGSATAVEELQALFAGCGDDERLAAGWARILPLYFHRPDRIPEGCLSQVRFRAAGHNAGLPIFTGFDQRASLPGIAAPTLVVSGEDDFIMPPRFGGQRVADLIPGARHVVIPECGHFPFVEAPAAFHDAVGGFLANLGEG